MIWRTWKDRWCRSFLFALDGEEASTLSATTPLMLSLDGGKSCVGELAIGLKKGERGRGRLGRREGDPHR
jgi:hypothetical protein